MTSKNEKVLKFETFLNEVLRRDLMLVHKEKDMLIGTLSEYSQLLSLLEKMAQDPETFTASNLTSQVDLGSNFYVRAKVNKSEYIFVNIGLGIFAELTVNEALSFVKKKESSLEERIEKLKKDSVKIKAQIKMVIEGLRELQSLHVSEH